MISRPALLAATLLSAACVAPSPPVTTTTEANGACDLKVEFASIGTGIDRATLQKVEGLLSGDTGVSTIDRKRWGKEGETRLCVETRTKGDTARLFEAAKRLFPTTSIKPISVEPASGQQFGVPTPARPTP
jgi:hypothetical protein